MILVVLQGKQAPIPHYFFSYTKLCKHGSEHGLVAVPGGRLREQRDLCYQMITEIPGITCVKPSGALYLFPKIDQKRFKVKDDVKMILDLLVEEKVLLVQGTGFSWPDPDHFRIAFLPNIDDLKEAISRIARFFSHYKESAR
jgi:alanine-synthesizing transaminase